MNIRAHVEREGAVEVHAFIYVISATFCGQVRKRQRHHRVQRSAHLNQSLTQSLPLLRIQFKVSNTLKPAQPREAKSAISEVRDNRSAK